MRRRHGPRLRPREEPCPKLNSGATEVALGRADYAWLAAHPPLPALGAAAELLSALGPADPRRAVWVPSGEDRGGLNDRYALAPRRAPFAA